MKLKTIIILSSLFLLSAISLFPQQEFVIRIQEGMPTIPLAIPKFIVHGATADLISSSETLHEVFSADMKYSRVFKPLPKKHYSYIKPIDPGNIRFYDWESISAKLLMVGEISKGEGNTVIFSGKVYDVKSERYIFGKRYTVEQGLLRLAAHRMSNEMMKIYGEPEIFTTKIIYVSNRDGNDEIYMMDYDGHNQTRLTFNKVKDYMPAWATDGRSFAYTSYRFTKASLFIFNPFDGTHIEVQSERTNWASSFSPDGKKLAFSSTIAENNSEIFVCDSNGKKIKRITFNKSVDTAPSWSPTSRQIAFTSDRSGRPHIYIMDAEGSNTRRVSFGGTYHDGPAWSPDGDRLAYVSRVDQIFDIYILNLRTQNISKLTESFARNESPCWSPDGRHLIISSNRSGKIQLYTIDYDGTNVMQLTFQGDNKLPDWSRK